jgi:SAM-dependent methyltransferase
MLRLAQALLGHPAIYLLAQRALRATRPRYQSLAELDVRPGHRVLDVGCGPAYYLGHLPREVEYHGFDTDARYLDYARRRFADRGTFHLGHYDEEQRARLPRFDRVLLMGLLHHLDDTEAHALLDLLARSLASDGVVVALDTCFDDELSALQTFLARHDRGKFVRSTAAYRTLAGAHFGRVDGRLLDRRAPVRLFLMKLQEPRAA